MLIQRRRSVPRSKKYPRVAVLLGVSSKWYLPLLLCRALSLTSAFWWALPIFISFLGRVVAREGNVLDVLDVITSESTALERRIARLEVLLGFLWVCLTACYLIRPHRHVLNSATGIMRRVSCASIHLIANVAVAASLFACCGTRPTYESLCHTFICLQQHLCHGRCQLLRRASGSSFTTLDFDVDCPTRAVLQNAA